MSVCPLLIFIHVNNLHMNTVSFLHLARDAVQHGNTAAILRFSVELIRPLLESIKMSWYLKLREEPNPNNIACPLLANRGHPMLGSYDREVAE